MRLPLASLAALAIVAAGCVSPSAVKPEGVLASASPLVVSLRAAAAPALDGAGVVTWLSGFVTAHAPRITGTLGEKAAGDDLAAQLAALGYTVEDHKYNARGLPSVDGPLRAIVGVKKGATQPDEIILLGGHYDTSFTVGNRDVAILPVGLGLTTQAAYDNGSGTAMVMEQARLLANVTTNKTIMLAFFNGEEEGLLASAAYAADLVKTGAKVEVYTGFDMIGINYPSAGHCLCLYAGKQANSAADLNPLQEAVAFDLLGLPRGNDTVQVFDNHDTRNSDEKSFVTAGFRTMRWAGMAAASDYWAYHKLNDTVDTMTAQAGDADTLAKGIEHAAATAYYVTLAVDRSLLGAG